MDTRKVRTKEAQRSAENTASSGWRILSAGEVALVVLISVLACVVMSNFYQQDANWDLQNYHFYSVYALFNGRLDIDVAASQLQTWFNPLPSLIPYVLITRLSPRMASGVLAGLSAIPLVLVYMLSVLLLNPVVQRDRYIRMLVPALAWIGAFSSPMFRSELGTTFSDVVGGSLILAALAIVVAGEFRGRCYFLAGLLLGASVGLKLTNVFFVVGGISALLFVERGRCLRPIMLASVGAVLAYIPIGGLWNAYIAIKTGNPLFPAYNHVFKSPLYMPVPMLDTRFQPDSLKDALRYFMEWPVGLHPSAEVGFTDVRLTVVFVLLLVVLLSGRFVGSHEKPAGTAGSPLVFNAQCQSFVLVFFVVSFVVWIRQFGIQRYAVTLELLAPLVIIMLMSLVARSYRSLAIGTAICVLSIAALSEKANWGRAPFSGDWFEAQIPAELETGDTLFVMLSGAPTAYVIPLLPTSDVFVRIEGNMPITPDLKLGQRISEMVAAHTGALRTLAPADYPLADSSANLAAYGLTVDANACEDIPTKMGTLRSCKLRRHES